MFVSLDLVVKNHEKTDEKVASSDKSKCDQGLLADHDPWRVADSKEDWLEILAEIEVDERTPT